MDTVKLYLEFHKSTLAVNWAVAITISLIFRSQIPILLSMPVISLSASPLISILVIIFANEDEYYFYYNHGITKIKLFLMGMLLNAVVGIIWIAVYYSAKPS